MQHSHRAFTMACIFGVALIASTASAQTSHAHDHEHPDVVAGGVSSWRAQRSAPADSAPSTATGQISTTANNQILVELTPDDTTPANLFDLNDRTLIFTPDGYGGYSRSVQSSRWEDDIGYAVADGAEIQLGSFTFDFAGRPWGSFYVSSAGLLTFGESFTLDNSFRWLTMHEIAGRFVTSPTISPLYKPYYDARQHVSRRPDQVVVTWVATEPKFYVHGVPPVRPARFQVVLGADGSVRFTYRDVTFGDGIVGLFGNEQVTKTDLVAGIADPRDPELPGHLDLLDVAIYESNTDALIVEWTLRNDIPNPPSGTRYSYRLYFDTDAPYFDGDEDSEFMWSVDVAAEDSRTRGGRRLPTGSANRIALLVDDAAVFGLTAGVMPDAAQFDEGGFVQGNWNSRSSLITLPDAPPKTDLSRPAAGFSSRQSEVFRYRWVPKGWVIEDLVDVVACRVIEALGDEFDLFVFHSEFRIDSQESATGWRGRADVKGIGDVGGRRRTHPCSGGRVKGHWARPVWMRSPFVRDRRYDEVAHFNRGLWLFAHEFTHSWTAHASFSRNGGHERLFDLDCRCHWRSDLHVAAAFPWPPGEPGVPSVMGGYYWRENGDGTFTPVDAHYRGGHAWLDLYMVGLAEASEVPDDMFILRNLKPVHPGEPYGPHTGEKEIVTIEQIVAAEGPREPAAAEAQKDFNAGFVYLLEPGRTPDPEMLRLHAEYRDKVLEHWSHVTGGRSLMTTTVPSVPTNRSPAAVGTLPDLTLHVGDTPAIVDVGGAFRDPDGDPLTYRAASSAPAVATAGVSRSRATLTPLSVGMTTVTVTATDTGGARAMQRFAVSVTAPGTFTDHPIRPGTTPVRAIHFRELRKRIAGLRTRWRLPAVGWTDPILTAGVTPVRLVHLLELRSALAEAYARAGRAPPRWTDTAPAAGTTPIRAAHLMELRTAVLELE